MMKTTKRSKWAGGLVWVVCLLVPVVGHAADAVNVTMEADSTSLAVGETTTVRVYGQIDGAIEAESLQMTTWYIDVLNSNAATASGYASVVTTASDNYLAAVPYDGTMAGENLRGIHDWFLDTAGAGKGSRIELVSFEVTALAAGVSTYSVAPGTTLGLAHDFQVAKSDLSADPFTGGDYSAASVEITVGGSLDLSALGVTINVTGNQAELNFTPIASYDHTVEWSPNLLPGFWTGLPGGPHNSGTALHDITDAMARFYRVILTPQ